MVRDDSCGGGGDCDEPGRCGGAYSDGKTMSGGSSYCYCRGALDLLVDQLKEFYKSSDNVQS